MSKETMKLAIELLKSAHVSTDLVWKRHDCVQALEEALKQEQGEPTCKTHPDAPHGFVRNASHSEDRYVCECEFWQPPKQEHGDPVAWVCNGVNNTHDIDFDENDVNALPVGTMLYTTPRKCNDKG